MKELQNNTYLILSNVIGWGYKKNMCKLKGFASQNHELLWFEKK